MQHAFITPNGISGSFIRPIVQLPAGSRRRKDDTELLPMSNIALTALAF